MDQDEQTRMIINKIIVPIALVCTPIYPIILVLSFKRDYENGREINYSDPTLYISLILWGVAIIWLYQYSKNQLGWFRKKDKS